MIRGKVSCLMATYGRFGRVCEALTCFLLQDYAKRELVILNNHPEPLYFNHPLVTIVNDPGYPSLGHCRNALLSYADGEFLRTWDDDDLYLPWCISQGVRHIGVANAWKPHRSWFTDGGEKFELKGNAMEASMTFRTKFVKARRYANSAGTEHEPLVRDGVATTELNHKASYVYRWGCGDWHISGTIGDGTDEKRTKDWLDHNRDVRPGEFLAPVPIAETWMKMSKSVPKEIRHEWLESVLAILKMRPFPILGHPKVLAPGEVREAIKRKGTLGELIAAPGCFDFLHNVHRALLQWARRMGGSLAVVINDDEGVSAQKGPDRPAWDLCRRVTELANLEYVDYVVPFSGVSDLKALILMQPEVVVKGPEWYRKVVPCYKDKFFVKCMDKSSYDFHTTDLLEEET